MFSYQGGEQGRRSCVITPRRFMYPKVRAKTGRVPGGPKMKRKMETTKGAPKCVMP